MAEQTVTFSIYVARQDSPERNIVKGMEYGISDELFTIDGVEQHLIGQWFIKKDTDEKGLKGFEYLTFEQLEMLELGACCHSGYYYDNCDISTKLECETDEGEFIGIGSTCLSHPCGELGCCCSFEESGELRGPYITFEHRCIENDIWLGNVACVSGFREGEGATGWCIPEQLGKGACCVYLDDAKEACLMLTEQVCDAFGGTWQGEDSTCVPDNPCQEYRRPCCMSDGQCVDDVDVDECVFLGGQPLYFASSCEYENCDDPFGACCVIGKDGLPTCKYKTEYNCKIVMGKWMGAWTHCENWDCTEVLSGN